MKFLFTPVGSQVTIYAVAPLATAARNAGHEVLLAANEPLMEFAEAIGIPAVSIMPQPSRHFVMTGPTTNTPPDSRDLQDEMLAMGRGFAKMATAGLDALLDLTQDWPPDLIVGGSMSYAAGLLATHLKIPYVRHAEYLGIPTTSIDPPAEDGLRPQLQHLGLAGLPDPALFIEACPPSLRPSRAPTGQPMRWIPSNRQRRLQRWMYTRPHGRQRVLITSGTHFRMLPATSLRRLADELTTAGAEVLIAAPDRAADELRPQLGDIHIGWIPLDVVAPTCDLVVNHGGATTAMTVMAAGAPQLIYPPNYHTKAIAHALTDYGAALTVTPHRQEPDHDMTDAFTAGCQDILSNSAYAHRAHALATENAALPTPAQLVHTLETLATTHA